MARPWGLTGIGRLSPTLELSDQIRQHLTYELGRWGIKPDKEFFDALKESIGAFISLRDLSEKSSPAKVRGNLRVAIDAALKFNDSLNQMDGNSRQLVEEASGKGVGELQRKLEKILLALHEARHLANEYPKSGRNVEFDRLWLAESVARAIRDHLKCEPTATKEGVFESVLTIVLEDPAINKGKPVKSVHDLARRSVKMLKNPEE